MLRPTIQCQNSNDVYLHMIAHARICITHVHAIMLYTSIYLSMYSTLSRIESIFHVFRRLNFSKRLERYCSTLLLSTATMVETPRIPHLLFWNERHRFAPNSKFHGDRETGERVELSQSTQDEEFVART